MHQTVHLDVRRWEHVMLCARSTFERGSINLHIAVRRVRRDTELGRRETREFGFTRGFPLGNSAYRSHQHIKALRSQSDD